MMDRAINQIIEQINSEDFVAKEEAILQIAMLLEKNSLWKTKLDFYNSILVPELTELSLNESQKTEIIKSLSKLLFSEKLTSSLIWAVGKADCCLSIDSLLALFCKSELVLDEECCWQLLTSIDNFLSLSTAVPLSKYVVILLAKYDFSTFLRKADFSKSTKLQKLKKTIQKTHGFDKEA